MFAVRNIAQAAPRACRLAGKQRSFMSGPPRVRISFPEKVAHGIVIAAGVTFTPLWILHHLSDYKGKSEADEE